MYGYRSLNCWWIDCNIAFHHILFKLPSLFLQVRKGTGFVPVSDLPSEDEEEDEQVGGPFGNNSNLSVGSELKVTFSRCAFTLLLGKTPVCLTVSFSVTRLHCTPRDQRE